MARQRVRIVCRRPPPSPPIKCDECDALYDVDAFDKLEPGRTVDRPAGRIELRSCARCGHCLTRVVFPKIDQLPSFSDAEVWLVAEDGTETPITGVTSLRWEAKPGEPAYVTLTVVGAEVDVEGELLEAIGPGLAKTNARGTCWEISDTIVRTNMRCPVHGDR